MRRADIAHAHDTMNSSVGVCPQGTGKDQPRLIWAGTGGGRRRVRGQAFPQGLNGSNRPTLPPRPHDEFEATGPSCAPASLAALSGTHFPCVVCKDVCIYSAAAPRERRMPGVRTDHMTRSE
jgi:hypothetical protein